MFNWFKKKEKAPVLKPTEGEYIFTVTFIHTGEKPFVSGSLFFKDWIVNNRVHLSHAQRAMNFAEDAVKDGFQDENKFYSPNIIGTIEMRLVNEFTEKKEE